MLQAAERLRSVSKTRALGDGMGHNRTSVPEIKGARRNHNKSLRILQVRLHARCRNISFLVNGGSHMQSHLP